MQVLLVYVIEYLRDQGEHKSKYIHIEQKNTEKNYKKMTVKKAKRTWVTTWQILHTPWARTIHASIVVIETSAFDWLICLWQFHTSKKNVSEEEVNEYKKLK